MNQYSIHFFNALLRPAAVAARVCRSATDAGTAGTRTWESASTSDQDRSGRFFFAAAASPPLSESGDRQASSAGRSAGDLADSLA